VRYLPLSKAKGLRIEWEDRSKWDRAAPAGPLFLSTEKQEQTAVGNSDNRTGEWCWSFSRASPNGLEDKR